MPDPREVHTLATRRDALVTLATLGAASVAVGAPEALGAAGEAVASRLSAPSPSSTPASAVQPSNTISASTIAEAEKLAGIAFTDAERAQMAKSIEGQIATFRARAPFGALDNQLAPAQVFRVLLPGETVDPRIGEGTLDAGAAGAATPATDRPLSDDDLDFATVETLGRWMRAGLVTSRRLVERSLARLKKADPTLRCVITLIEGPARAEADARDAEARAGAWRGPLHGIPYGLKDLFDTAGIATTWGAEPWRDRVPTGDATVVARLRDAGAVCVAKTAVGALAYGDIWFGGTCRNPWNPEQGSSGSSAGSASAVAAGCVPFAIGTETLGSIVSPSVRCGTTGLRPTFGRVPRDGCMALCWSWDKVGPIARSVVDTGLVLAAINGASAADASSVSVPFTAPAAAAVGAGAARLRLAYDPRWFAGPMAPHAEALEAAKAEGMELVERTVTPPADPSLLVTSLMAEAAASFEEMTRSGADDQLSWQADEAWPNSFRQSWFIPALELVQAERLRRVFMQWMRGALEGVDALILPPFAGGMLVVTNATGHPSLVLRSGFDEEKGAVQPRAITLIGRPFDEATLLRAGGALEATLAVAGRRPQMPWMT
jgi:Asp-tRNA(Asn)/Glu-tRNA(Gln) amidotransferase A subunit family amidase